MGPKGSATHDTWGSFTHAFEAAQQIVTTRARLGYFWPLFELSGDKSSTHTKAIKNWLDPVVSQVLEDSTQAKISGKSSDEETSFLQHLAESTDGI